VRVPCGTVGNVALTGLAQASEFECTGHLPDSEHLRPEAFTPPVVVLICLHREFRPTDLILRNCPSAGLPAAIRGEQHPVLSLAHGFMKGQLCRRLQNDCGTEQSSGTHQERQQASEDPVRQV
jgi:hypothetical protein